MPRPPTLGLYPHHLLQVPHHRRRLHRELERVVLERRDRHRHRRFRFVLLRPAIGALDLK